MSKTGSAPWYLVKSRVAVRDKHRRLINEVKESMYNYHKGFGKNDFVLIKIGKKSRGVEVNWSAPGTRKFVRASKISPVTSVVSTWFKSKPQFYQEIRMHPHIINPGIGQAMKWISAHTSVGSKGRDSMKEDLLDITGKIIGGDRDDT